MDEFDEATLREPEPERTKDTKFRIVSYTATDPDAPAALQGMARALIKTPKGLRLAVACATGRTPEEAASKLQSFYDEELGRLRDLKPRGRKPKAIETAPGTEPVDVGEIV